MKSVLTLAAFGIAALSSTAHAAKFANQFVEFELPANWQCNLEGAEWVCQSADEAKKREAIIVLAAKLRGDQDSLDQYMSYLKEAKVFNSIAGKQVKSEPKYAKSVSLNGHAWIDSLHMESEIPGFYTRYLATVKSDIGVLVTYSVNKNKYQQYLNEFENMVRTLRVFRKAGGINAAPANSNLFNNVAIPPAVQQQTVFGVNPNGGADDQAPVPKEDDTSFYLMLLGVGVVLYILWKRKQSGR